MPRDARGRTKDSVTHRNSEGPGIMEKRGRREENVRPEGRKRTPAAGGCVKERERASGGDNGLRGGGRTPKGMKDR